MISKKGEHVKKFKLSLGNSEIFSLLESGDEEEEHEEPAPSRRGKKENKPSRRRSEVAKSKPKSPEVVKVKWAGGLIGGGRGKSPPFSRGGTLPPP